MIGNIHAKHGIEAVVLQWFWSALAAGESDRVATASRPTASVRTN